MRRWYLFVLVCIGFGVTPAYAQSGSWAEQLQGLTDWAKSKEVNAGCEEHCFALSSMALSGALASNQLTFALSGEVWSDNNKPQMIPLFGPARDLRITEATLNNKPASISFKDGIYYLRVSDKSFVLRGKLSFEGDQTLTIPGPLNQLTSSMSDASFAGEVNTLSGLQDATIQLELTDTSPEPEEPLPAPVPQPPSYQISRAFRVEEELRFEYRIFVQSGQEVGTVHLPLLMKEQVLDVVGATDWKLDGDGISIVTTGNSANIIVTGKLPTLTTLALDPRSTFEYWFIERDPTHRVLTKGAAKQLELDASPFVKTLSSARLFLAKKGDTLEITVRPLETVEALAAVISEHHRRMIWTKDGDMVFEDRLRYENGGLEYLPYGTTGTPIYEELDGSSRRLVKDKADPARLLLAIPTGGHSLRLQSLDFAKPAWFFGSLFVPAPSQPLEVSHARVSLALPAEIYPLYVTDQGWVGPGSARDLVALVGSLLFALLFFTGWRGRTLGGITVLGVWGVAPMVFWPMLLGMSAMQVLWWAWRHFSGGRLFFAWGALLIAGVFVYPLVETLAETAALGPTTPMVDVVSLQSLEAGKHTGNTVTGNSNFNENGTFNAITGSTPTPEQNVNTNVALNNPRRDFTNQIQEENQPMEASLADGVTMKAVRPVALPLPSYQREINVFKELVTKDRPLAPTLYYVTSWVVWPFFILWLLSLAATLFLAWPSLLLALLQIKKESERLGEKTPEIAPKLPTT
jgi:hypothetical protein